MIEKVNKFLRDNCIDVIESSRTTCQGSIMDSKDCSWYHGAWPMLRVLGLVSNPFWHQEFYEKAIEDFGIAGAKTLVAGTADISMPAICSSANNADVDIIDVCETPIVLCRKFADIYDLNWQSKMLSIEAAPQSIANTYNLVLNDAFLTRFNRQKRPEVLRYISDILIPRGKYVTTVRLGEYHDKGYRSAKVLRDKFVNKAIAQSKKLLIHEEELVEALAKNYIDNMLSYRFENVKEIQELAANCDLFVESLEKHQVTGESEITTYARVVFSKK